MKILYFFIIIYVGLFLSGLYLMCQGCNLIYTKKPSKKWLKWALGVFISLFFVLSVFYTVKYDRANKKLMDEKLLRGDITTQDYNDWREKKLDGY